MLDSIIGDSERTGCFSRDLMFSSEREETPKKASKVTAKQRIGAVEPLAQIGLRPRLRISRCK